MNYTVTLTETEKLGLSFAAVDPQEWIDNVVHERARVAVDEIVKLAVEKLLESGQNIPGSKDEIVATAYSNGWVKTAAQVNEESLAQKELAQAI